MAVAALQSLEVSGLSCVRAGRLVFRGLGFRVRAGQALTVEGPNGSGKTSLLRMIAGFLPQESGTIRIDMVHGQPAVAREERSIRIGWLGHQDGAKAQMTPGEILGFHAQLYGVPVSGAAQALQRVGLARASDIPVQHLSAGQRKRLALARLELSGRPLWLLDEPLSSLDADGRALAALLVRDHCARGGIAIIATHEPLDLECERLSLAA